MTIAEFLEARIAEDEAEAEKGGYHNASGGVFARDNYGCLLVQPSRVLAESTAKRAILDLYELHRTNRDARRSPLARAAEDEQAARDRRTQEARTRIAEDAVRSLAAVYSDHPDYDKDWAL